MRLSEAVFLAEALDGWNGWHVVSVDLYGEIVTNDDGYKVKLAKNYMHAQVDDPDVDHAQEKLEAVEAGETYPNMRPWRYGFIDAVNRGAIKVEFYPIGGSDRFPPMDGVTLRITGYDEIGTEGVLFRVEPLESKDGKE